MWDAIFDNINQMVNAKQWWKNTESKFGISSDRLYTGYDLDSRGN